MNTTLELGKAVETEPGERGHSRTVYMDGEAIGTLVAVNVRGGNANMSWRFTDATGTSFGMYESKSEALDDIAARFATFVDDDEVGSAYPDGTASFTGKVTEAEWEEALAEAGWVTVGKWVGQPTKRSVKVRRA